MLARYTSPPLSFGQLSAQLNWRYKSKEHADLFVCEPQINCAISISTIEPGNYGILNGRVTLDLPRWNTEIAIVGTNLFDREHFHWGDSFTQLGYYVRIYGLDRRIAVEMTYRFGAEAAGR